MHHHLSAMCAAALLGVTSLAAVAQPQFQPGGPQGGPGRPSPVQPGPQDAYRQPPAPHMQPERLGPGPAAHAMPRPPAHSHAQQRHGAGPDHRWTKGSRVPPQYRSQHYVVKDWQRHGLKRPARGQQWVQNGNDYLLVAVASGVIAQIVFGH